MIDELTISNHDAIDKIEASMLQVGVPTEANIRNFFVAGLYVREMFVPVKEYDGVFITSEIHKTEHLFSLDKGSLIVSDGINPPVLMQAPYKGITKPGTRRIALVLEDVVWTTYHPNPEGLNEDEIRRKILMQHENPYITEELRQKMLQIKHNILSVESKKIGN